MFNITLCINRNENNLLGKTFTSGDTYNVIGTLKEGTDIINPSFLIDISQFSSNDYFKYNYLFTTELKRNYFINNIIIVTNYLIEYQCHIDVLDSYANEIKQLYGILSRTSKDNFIHKYIDDPEMIFSGEIEEEIYELNPYNFDIDLRSSAEMISQFKEFFKGDIKGFKSCFFVTTICNSNDTASHNFLDYPQCGIAKSSEMSLYKYGSSKYKIQAVICEQTANGSAEMYLSFALSSILNAIISDTSIQSYFVNIIAFPFSFELNNFDNPDELYDGENYYIEYGDSKHINLNNIGNHIKSYEIDTQNMLVPSGYFRLKYIEKYNDFRDISPYCSVELLLPMYGTISLNTNMLHLYPYIHVSYCCDYTTGEAAIYVGLGNTDDNIAIHYVGCYKCQLGSEIPLNSTNAADIRRTLQAQTITAVTNTAGGFFGSAPKGIVSQAAAGVSGLINGLGDYFASKIVNVERAQKDEVNMPTELCQNVYASKPILFVRHNKSVVQILPTYTNTNGRPSGEYVKIDSLFTSSVHGFHKFQKIHIDNVSATSDEKDEIERILTSGFMY